MIRAETLRLISLNLIGLLAGIKNGTFEGLPADAYYRFGLLPAPAGCCTVSEELTEQRFKEHRNQINWNASEEKPANRQRMLSLAAYCRRACAFRCNWSAAIPSASEDGWFICSIA